MNPYRILKVKKTASPEEIKDAYRRESLKHHPDRNPGKDTSAKFNEVNAAYRVLSDPARRARYDSTGEVDDAGPNNTESETLAILSTLYCETIVEAVTLGKDLKRINLVEVLAKKLKEKAGPIRKEVKDMEKIEAAFRESASRFEGEEAVTLQAISANHLANLTKQKAARTQALDRFDAALKIVKGFTYRTDKGESEESFAAFLADATKMRATTTGPFFVFE